MKIFKKVLGRMSPIELDWLCELCEGEKGLASQLPHHMQTVVAGLIGEELKKHNSEEGIYEKLSKMARAKTQNSRRCS